MGLEGIDQCKEQLSFTMDDIHAFLLYQQFVNRKGRPGIDFVFYNFSIISS